MEMSTFSTAEGLSRPKASYCRDSSILLTPLDSVHEPRYTPSSQIYFFCRQLAKTFCETQAEIFNGERAPS